MTDRASVPSAETRERVLARPWFHSIDLGGGLVTPGRVSHAYLQAELERLRFPADLRGLSVLDIGAWDGFFSFEAERRGAARVVAFDVTPADYHGFALAREVLNSRVEYVHGAVYKLSPEEHGTFDVVLCLGVIYHLRYPLLAIDRVWEVTRQYALFETQVLDEHVVMPDRSGARLRDVAPALADVCLYQFHRNDELGGDFSNWFVPNLKAVSETLASAGFEPELLAHWGQRAAFKALRKPGLPEYKMETYDGLRWEPDASGRLTPVWPRRERAG